MSSCALCDAARLIVQDLAVIKHIFTGPFRGSKGPTTYRRDIFYAALRQITGGFSPAQAQSLAPGTDAAYRWVAKRKGAKPNSVDLDSGAKGHWIGKKDAKYVMLYIHGMQVRSVRSVYVVDLVL